LQHDGHVTRTLARGRCSPSSRLVNVGNKAKWAAGKYLVFLVLYCYRGWKVCRVGMKPTWKLLHGEEEQTLVKVAWYEGAEARESEPSSTAPDYTHGAVDRS